MENLLFILLAILFGVAVISLVIYAIVTRNRGAQVNPPNGGGNQNTATFGSCRTGYDVVFRVVNMPQIPAEATLVPRRNLCWIAPVVVALFLLTLFFIYLAAKPADGATTPPVTGNQTVVTPAPVNPPAQTVDPATIVNPVSGKIDESTKIIVDKIDGARKNSAAGHKKATEQVLDAVETVRTNVVHHTTLLHEISDQIAGVDANITSLRGELNAKVNELKTALGNSASSEQINQLTDQVNKLRGQIENLEKQKNSIGDPD